MSKSFFETVQTGMSHRKRGLFGFGALAILMLVLQLAFWGAIIWMAIELVGQINEVGLKALVMGIWEGPSK